MQSLLKRPSVIFRTTVVRSRITAKTRTRRCEPPQAFFNFGKKSLRTDSESAGMVGNQSREEYGYDDVEQYFNYMGMLAEDGSYDRMESYLNAGLHPVDILLLWASAEGDDPKVEELLKAGADLSVKDMEGKTPLELAGNDRSKDLTNRRLNVSELCCYCEMSMLQQLLVADAAGPAARKLYENSGKALAGLVPIAYFTEKDGGMQKAVDFALAPIIVYHAHVSMNCVISDYVPKPVRMLSRYGVLGASALCLVGLTKLTISGPGLTGFVKKLWE